MAFRIYCAICTFFLASLISCSEPERTSHNADTVFKKGRIWDPEKGADIPIHIEDYPLKGKVKTMSYRFYSLAENGTETRKKLLGYGLIAYDTFGHLIVENSYDAQGKPVNECTYEYENSTRRKKWHIVMHEPGIETTITYKYDSKDNIVEEIETHKDANKLTRTVFVYDNDGNSLKETVYDKEGKVTRLAQSSYDSKGNQTEYLDIEPDGNVKLKIEATYDENGLITSQKDHIGGMTSLFTYKYLARGKPLERTLSWPNGKIDHKTLYKYDSKDNLTETVRTSFEKGEIQILINSIQNEYDIKGNIIKQTVHEERNGRLERITLMEAEYTYHE